MTPAITASGRPAVFVSQLHRPGAQRGRLDPAAFHAAQGLDCPWSPARRASHDS
jgi:hypothetical protein